MRKNVSKTIQNITEEKHIHSTILLQTSLTNDQATNND